MRIQLLKDLATLLGERDLVKRVAVRIDVAKLFSGKDPAEMAFMFFVERVDQLLAGEKDIGLLIGDFEHQNLVEKATGELADYKARGTLYEYGREIRHLIDTVHFCRSHHSRLLQLADVYAWFMQLPHGPSRSKQPQTSLIDFAAKDADILWPDKYKFWPPDN